MTDYFILLLGGHLIADFYLQTEKTIASKKENQWYSWSWLWHVFIHAAFSFLLSLCIGYNWEVSLIACTVIGITHWAVDVWKTTQPDNSLRAFIIDQLCHIVVIAIISFFIYESYDSRPLQLYILLIDQNLEIIIAYLLIIKPTSVYLGLFFDQWKDDLPKTKSLARAGETIGYLERILSMTLIIAQQFEAIAFVFAAKSFMRHEGTDPDKMKINEYILMGTLLSFLITTAVGALLFL